MLTRSSVFLVACLLVLSGHPSAGQKTKTKPKPPAEPQPQVQITTTSQTFASSTSGGSASASARAFSFSDSPGTSSESSATAISDGGSDVTAVSESTAKDGATVKTETVAKGTNGSSVTAVTSAEGKGNVVIDEKTTVVASNKEAREVVATIVSKAETDGVSKQLRKEVMATLNSSDPLLFSRTMGKGLRDPSVRSLFISVGNRILNSVGCNEFKALFQGNTMPIALSEGAGEKIDRCLFDPCPKGCCKDIAAIECGCKDGLCKWMKPERLQFANSTASFFRCATCTNRFSACKCQ